MCFRLHLNVMWEICSQNILDPIYTCIFVHLWLDASTACKTESTGVQRPFAVSKSHSRERVWGGEKEARNGRGMGSIEQFCFQTFIALFFHLSALFIYSPSMGAVHIPNLLLYCSAQELFLISRWKTFLSPMSGCQRAGCSSSSRLPMMALSRAWIEAFYFSAEQCDERERAWNCSLFSGYTDLVFFFIVVFWSSYSFCQSVALQDHQ